MSSIREDERKKLAQVIEFGLKICGDYLDLSELERRCAEAESKRYVSTVGEQIQKFLVGFFESIRRTAPPWTSEPIVPYDFLVSEEYVREHFPAGCTEKEFVEKLTSFFTKIIHNSDDYTTKAHVGWALAVLTNVLGEKNQQHIIWGAVVPTLRSQVHPLYVVAEFIHPAMVDMLREENQVSFLDRVVDFIIADKNSKIDSDKINLFDDGMLLYHVRRYAHIGVYNLEDAKTKIARALVDKIGASKLVEWINPQGMLGPRIHFLINCLPRLDDEQRKNVVTEIDRQIGMEQVTNDFANILRYRQVNLGVYPWMVIRFFPQMMTDLSGEQQEAYASRLFDKLGDDVVPIIKHEISQIGDNKDLRIFVDAFSYHMSCDIVCKLTETALDADYYAADGNYGHLPNSYFDRSKFAIALHNVIPQKCQSFFENMIIGFLEQASPDGRGDALLKASLLARQFLTQQGHLRTRDVDFYRMRGNTNDAIAHIKPSPEFNAVGFINSCFFIGSLSDYFRAITRKEYFAPRFEPPHSQELYPSERYGAILPMLLANENGASAGDAALPTFLETLRMRNCLPDGVCLQLR